MLSLLLVLSLQADPPIVLHVCSASQPGMFAGVDFEVHEYQPDECYRMKDASSPQDAIVFYFFMTLPNPFVTWDVSLQHRNMSSLLAIVQPYLPISGGSTKLNYVGLTGYFKFQNDITLKAHQVVTTTLLDGLYPNDNGLCPLEVDYLWVISDASSSSTLQCDGKMTNVAHYVSVEYEIRVRRIVLYDDHWVLLDEDGRIIKSLKHTDAKTSFDILIQLDVDVQVTVSSQSSGRTRGFNITLLSVVEEAAGSGFPVMSVDSVENYKKVISDHFKKVFKKKVRTFDEKKHFNLVFDDSMSSVTLDTPIVLEYEASAIEIEASGPLSDAIVINTVTLNKPGNPDANGSIGRKGGIGSTLCVFFAIFIALLL